MTREPLPHSRRTVLATTAWATPAIVLAGAAPAHAVSGGTPTVTLLATRGDTGNGIGTIDLSLDPDPATTPVPVTTYDDAGTTTTSFTKTGTSGTAGLYQLVFTSTTHPCPATITVTLSINDYGTVMPTVLMAAPGTLDTTFTDPNLNSPAYGVAVLAGGKILATGNFTAAGSDNTPHGRIARFNPDGTPDPDFGDPNLKSANAYASAQRVAIQDDGGILVTGDFITAGAGDDAYRFLARLGPDGGVDYSFRNPDIDGGDGGPTVGTGRGVAVQADGKVVVAGYFAAVGPESNPTPGSSERTPYGNLARFNADGTLDTTFINPHLDQFAHAVVIQPDGKILVAGSFTHVGAAAIPCQGLARFNPDGTPDPTFEDPQLGNNISGAGSCRALALQDDGKILVTGNFTTAGADNRPYRWLARINSDGTPDPTFENPDLDDGGEGGATGWGVAVQSDGRILVVGGFDTAAGQPRNGLARYHSNGSLDGGFANPNLTAAGAVAVQADGQILVCGNFITAGTGNTPYRHLARFHG